MVKTDNGTIWEHWSDGWAIGFKVIHPSGKVKYIILNPSGGNDASDASKDDVFLYVEDDPTFLCNSVCYIEPFQD